MITKQRVRERRLAKIRWVETFKGAVLASEYDAEAPMYVSRFDQATWFLLHAIGVTPASIKKQKLRVAIVRQNYQFLAELRGGGLVTTRSASYRMTSVRWQVQTILSKLSLTRSVRSPKATRWIELQIGAWPL